MKKAFVIFSFLFSVTAFSQNSFKKTIDLSTQDSKVDFFAVGKPSLIKINGTGGKVTGQVDVENNQVQGLIKVPLQNMTTGISLRDEHMKKKYLEVEKFPEATLQITEFKMAKDFLKEIGSQKNIPFKGKLTVHGVAKEVQGTADLESTEKALQIIAKTNTNITDHKIDLPTYLGIKVADDVAIQTDIKITK